ncbi:MAG TPA: EAL domain-containing protein, partial [Mycobacterium sp.]|nr:EAL domain-containing protein [Mycobacterium sp.]
LTTSRIVGVEALLRWPRPDGEFAEPEEFLPLVRRHGLMSAITEFVLTRALDDAAVWRDALFDLPLALNFFAPSVAHPGFPAAIARALRDRGFDPAMLTVEITEDLLLANLERTRMVLEQLRSNGIRIAIDDFGSGYSALSYLRELPIDEVKLDRFFIAPTLSDPRAAAVVRAVIGLARELGLTTVAEGIENAETVTWLREQGCDVGQGFFLSPPLPLDRLLELLAAGSTGPDFANRP